MNDKKNRLEIVRPGFLLGRFFVFVRHYYSIFDRHSFLLTNELK